MWLWGILSIFLLLDQQREIPVACTYYIPVVWLLQNELVAQPDAEIWFPPMRLPDLCWCWGALLLFTHQPFTDTGCISLTWVSILEEGAFTTYSWAKWFILSLKTYTVWVHRYLCMCKSKINKYFRKKKKKYIYIVILFLRIVALKKVKEKRSFTCLFWGKFSALLKHFYVLN